MLRIFLYSIIIIAVVGVSYILFKDGTKDLKEAIKLRRQLKNKKAVE